MNSSHSFIQTPFGLPIASLALEREDTSPKTTFQWLEHAVGCGARCVVLPFGFPQIGDDAMERQLQYWAKKLHVHLVGGYLDKDFRRTAVIARPDGSIAGRAYQTHRLPDEEFTLGAILEPIYTEHGYVGLTIGSDALFPETHLNLARQGARILIHLDLPRTPHEHGPQTLLLRARAFDTHRPLIIARATSNLLKLAGNEEMQIAGTPMEGSQIIDQNGVILADSGFSLGIAFAELRLRQHCIIPLDYDYLHRENGTEVYKLKYVGSRENYFGPLRRGFSPKPRPKYKKRKVRVAVLTHFYYKDSINGDDEVFLNLMEEACRHAPDIIMTTEMGQACRPDSTPVAETIDRMRTLATRANSYLLLGGLRPHKPGTPQDRISHGLLWDRSGNIVFESAIMLYGKGCGHKTFDTDFGRIGIRICGDVYAPELDRLFALQDADIVFNPSMSWGGSGSINTLLNQARALDNGMHIVSGHLAFSDAFQRSHVIDPTGMVVAASKHYDRSVLIADLNLDQPTGVFVRDAENPPATDPYLAVYRGTSRHRQLTRAELLSLRRPELYTSLDVDDKIAQPS